MADIGDFVMDFTVSVMAEGAGSESRQAVTDVAGRFEIQGLSAGTYVVGGRFENIFEPLAAEPVTTTVAVGETTNVTLTAFPAVRISGTVKDQDGQSVSSAVVSFWTEYGLTGFLFETQVQLTRETSTSAKGRYEITGLFHGRIHGRASKEGYRSEFDPPDGYNPFDLFQVDQAKIIVAKPGESIENVDFVLHKKKERGEEENTFRGIVLDPDGNPAPGIEVATYFIMGMNDHCPWFSPGSSTITDSAGRFEIVDGRDGIRGLVVISSGEKPFRGWHEGRPLKEEEVVIQLIPCGWIAGIVGDGRGNPISGAQIYIQWDEGCNKFWGKSPRDCSSRSDGSFELGLLPPGNYRVYAQKAGYERGREGEKRLELAAGSVIDDIVLILRKPDTFRGRLVDQFGVPLAGWKVARQETGEDGVFSYRLLTGETFLRIRSDRWTHRGNTSTVTGTTSFKTGTIDYPDEMPADSTDFVLHVGGKVKGRVIFAGSGEPVPGIDVRLDSDPEKPKTPGDFTDCALSGYFQVSERLTGPDGTFEVQDVPVGHFVLSLSGDAILHKRITPVVVGGSLVADLGTIEVEPGRTIVGRLLDAVSGEPVYGAEYRVEARGVRRSGLPLNLSFREPDHEGRFRITRITPDLASIVFSAKKLGGIGPERYQMEEGPEIFGRVFEPDLSEPGEVDVGDVPLLLHRLRGQIVHGRSGRLLSGPDLSSLNIEASGGTDTWVRNYHGHDMEFTEDGFFMMTGARPDWERLEIRLPGFQPVTIQPLPAPDSMGVIHLGVVRLDPGCAVRGTVRGPSGEPANGARVYIRAPQENYASCDTDAAGGFLASGLSPGPANLDAMATNRNGSNPWIGPEGSKTGVTGYVFTILENRETTVNVVLPLSETE
jgi:protocatechuate 3,4-dioxygenase beta subunit